MTIYYAEFEILKHHYILGATKLGLCFVGSMDKGLDELSKFYPQAQLVADRSVLLNYEKQLREYLLGQRQQFSIKTDVSGTNFQESVWNELKKIPYGQISDYTKIAAVIGRPKAFRAVGTAIGKNPVLMVIPCHRVLTKSQKLGGYRGGLKMKQALLDLENAN